MLLTTIYNAVLTVVGITTTRAAALQLTYTLTHRSHSSTLSKPHPLTGTAYQRALHYLPMRDRGGKPVERVRSE